MVVPPVGAGGSGRGRLPSRVRTLWGDGNTLHPSGSGGFRVKQLSKLRELNSVTAVLFAWCVSPSPLGPRRRFAIVGSTVSFVFTSLSSWGN